MAKMNSTPTFLLLFLFIANISLSFAQTSAWGKYDVYERKNSLVNLGYMTTTITVPDYLGSYSFVSKGIMYTIDYNIAKLGNFVINSDNEINFFLRGAFRIGAGVGSGETATVLPNFPGTNFKYYVGTIDFFSMDVGVDYTYVFENGNAIVPRFQIGLIDIGGTISILDKGKIQDNSIGNVTAFSFSLKPSLYFDFGHSTLGLAFFINPFNFLDYRIVPNNLFTDNDNGFTYKDSLIKRFSVQILFSY